MSNKHNWNGSSPSRSLFCLGVLAGMTVSFILIVSGQITWLTHRYQTAFYCFFFCFVCVCVVLLYFVLRYFMHIQVGCLLMHLDTLL